MGPGPCLPYPEVTAALGRPLLGHLDEDFLAVLDETCERLRRVFQTDNALTLPVSGTGSAGMEAAFANTVEPGDVVVVGVNGLFGERMCEVARRCGAEVRRVEAPWGRPLDPDDLLSAHPSPKVVALVHAETSTGVRNCVEGLAGRCGPALLLVDTVTSLGGCPVRVDDWGIDVSYSATQKCLGVPPGLAPLTFGRRAWELRNLMPQSWYFDLGMIAEYVETKGQRKYHHTAPVCMVYALHAGLGVLLEEGLDEAWARHERCGRALQDGLESMGLELLAPAGHRLAQLTAVLVPDGRLPRGLDEAEVRRRLLREFGIEIGGGLGPYAGRMWRIGCMGNSARLRHVELLLAALGELIGA